jgi:hypothetical protein
VQREALGRPGVCTPCFRGAAKTSRVSLFVVLSLAVMSLGSAPAHAQGHELEEAFDGADPHPDAVARFMAGMPQLDPDSPYASLEDDRAWRMHRQAMDTHWGRFEEERLEAMRQWQSASAPKVMRSRLPVLYPFSGPDFATVHALYPNAPSYIFAALESVRSPPDFFGMSPPYLWKTLRGIVHALRDLYAVGYFITSHMQRDLVQRPSEGAVPSIYLLLARTGNELLSARKVTLTDDGVLQDVQEFKRGMVRGMRIRFRARGRDYVQELIYFDIDLKDAALAETPGFPKFIHSLGPTHSFLKAASYLMATKAFARIRALVLKVSWTLFQDDTGIPLRILDRADWTIEELFGTYSWPISGFGTYTHQPDLMALYKARTPAQQKRLPFSMGYHQSRERHQSHMLVTRRAECSYEGEHMAPHPATR